MSQPKHFILFPRRYMISTALANFERGISHEGVLSFQVVLSSQDKIDYPLSPGRHGDHL